MLAAGSARRMGGHKLDLEVGGAALLERAIAACGDRPAVVAVAPYLYERAVAAMNARSARNGGAVINDAPGRGMSHSLKLADAALGRPEARLAVIPADIPFLEARHVDEVFAAAEASGADVVFPRRSDGTPGHPVVFSPAARAAIALLPDGDTLRQVRDDPAFARLELPRDDDAYFFDVDTPEALARAIERLQ